MAVTITDVDTWFMNLDDGDVDQDLRKYTIDFGVIDGDEMTIYWDRRPINQGTGSFLLDYNTTTVAGASPTSAADMKTKIQALL